MFIAWHRLPDHQTLAVAPAAGEALEAGQRCRVVSWNIGFGAYEDDYGFFMDGGTQSWAWSRERLDANLQAIAGALARQDADFLLLQEVDTDSTRSYHVDEAALLREALEETGYGSVFAQNYDSPFLFYPLTQPHGAAKSGICTFSFAPIASAERRSLPVEESVMRLLDLDRCYSMSRVPLAGGDFNKDLLGDSASWFGAADRDHSWAQPIPDEVFADTDTVLVAPLDEAAPVPSCRNADSACHEGRYALTVDGFLASPNVTALESGVVDTGFRYSDHNPVYLEFVLEP